MEKEREAQVRNPPGKEEVLIMSTKTVLLTMLFFLALLHSGITSAETLYVNVAASGPRDGQSLETGFETIQEGIDAASDGDTVIVAEGTYTENINFNGKNIVLCSTDPADRTVGANTVIDGSKAGPVVSFSGLEDETCVLSGFTIRNGEAAEGGGICGGTAEQRTLATVENNVISGNAAQFGGGGLAYCDGIIRRNVITGNSGGFMGGGGLSDCDGIIVNNLIIGNSGALSGGGLFGCDGTIENNTIVDNLGGGLDPAGGLESCSGTIRNCIIWGNSEAQLSNCTDPTYCCIQDWKGGGEGNTAENPLFVDSDGPDGDPGTYDDNDYHLRPDSPCIDAGRNEQWMSDSVDLDGNARILLGAHSSTVDMGAYEYFPETWYVSGSVSASGDGKTWETAFQAIQEGIDAASDGDTVIVAQETYVENIHFNGKNIVLRSADPLEPTVVDSTIIDGHKAGSVVTFSGTEDETCVLSGFTIRNGEAQQGGGICGGKHEGPRTLATIEDNRIRENSAQFGGGGLAYCDGTVRRNVIAGNSGGFVGGGGLSECDGAILNNVIAGNSGALSGGGLEGCDGTIENNTIVGNAGGGLDSAGGLSFCQATIRNCIIWGNLGTTQISNCSAPTYCCIQDWAEGGGGNIADDPRFADPDGPDGKAQTYEDNDYHLRPHSPCIDAGKNENWMVGAVDLDGNPRIADGDRDGRPVVDMGAYEFTRPASLTWYVDGSVSHSGDGTSSETAFKTIREGMEMALSRDTVIVAPRTYDESVQFEGYNIILRSTDPRDPDVVESTIIDGNQTGSVVTFSGTENETCVLSGFTIQNGSAEYGGGILGAEAHATIKNNTITGNTATYGGGLAYCHGTIGDNTIKLNRAAMSGGGLLDCDGEIIDNIITGNEVAGGPLGGGGLSHCDGLIQNNDIDANVATGAGGGGLLVCNATILNNKITSNKATGFEASGGGLRSCDGAILNNVIAGNTAEAFGGGLAYCGGTVRSNLIAGNSAGVVGGGLYVCDDTIVNNTVVHNSCDYYGGGLGQCSGEIINCIVWANTAQDGAQLYDSSTPAYSCIQDWTAGGEGNTDADPQFVEAAGPDGDPKTYEDNNYRLSPASPCIDAGDNSALAPLGLDLDGNLRIAFGGKSLTVDMGAYEYNSAPFMITDVIAPVGGAIKLIWNSQPNDSYTIWSCSDLVVGPWMEEATISSEGESTSWTHPDPTSMWKFYRIEIK